MSIIAASILLWSRALMASCSRFHPAVAAVTAVSISSFMSAPFKGNVVVRSTLSIGCGWAPFEAKGA